MSRYKPMVSVVEDDASMRAALTDLLDSVGCQSTAFDNSEHFLSSDAVKTSDVIITDIQMGKLDGFALLDLLHDGGEVPIPVIVITALADEGSERRAVEKGCYAYLRKPFNPDTLLSHVRDALAQRDPQFS